jgi:pullulanase
VLWDKLSISAPAATEEERVNMHKLALSIVLTSQGISFLHAGTEFLRSKKGVENSFESPDSINAIDWDLKTKNKAVFDYVKGLIKLRKEHPAFRLVKAKQIARYLQFGTDSKDGLVSFTLDGKKAGDSWKRIRVYFNGTAVAKTILLDSKYWITAIHDNLFTSANNVVSSVIVAPFSCTILYIE